MMSIINPGMKYRRQSHIPTIVIRKVGEWMSIAITNYTGRVIIHAGIKIKQCEKKSYMVANWLRLHIRNLNWMETIKDTSQYMANN